MALLLNNNRKLFAKEPIMNRREKRARKKEDRGIIDFFRIAHLFFKDLGTWIDEMKDPRNQSDTLK